MTASKFSSILAILLLASIPTFASSSEGQSAAFKGVYVVDMGSHHISEGATGFNGPYYVVSNRIKETNDKMAELMGLQKQFTNGTGYIAPIEVSQRQAAPSKKQRIKSYRSTKLKSAPKSGKTFGAVVSQYHKPEKSPTNKVKSARPQNELVHLITDGYNRESENSKSSKKDKKTPWNSMINY